MPPPVLGLHHVTATVDEAQPDLDFCAGTLGLRLVKQTVNFDNHHVFHFYYGDERGTPGTIWTTFPYHGRRVRTGIKGAGQVTVTAFSVPAASLEFWRERLERARVAVADAPTAFGERAIVATDPSGLAVALIETDADGRQPWRGAGVDAAQAIRGLHSVTLTVHAAHDTVAFIEHFLGFERIDAAGGRIRMGAAGGAPGATVDIVADANAPGAVNGLGTVHHVAFAIASAAEQLELRRELIGAGFDVTDVMDRQYFQSIYFREPGGVLFEAATVAPGFGVDEAIESLGGALKLPPWQEPNRGLIQAGLPPITVPEPR